MPADKRQHGYKGKVEMDKTGVGTTYTVVGSLNGWTLDMSRDRVDATCFGDSNKVSLQGHPSYTGTIKGIWEPTESQLVFDAAMGDIPVSLKLTPSTLTPTNTFTGLAYLDASIEVTVDGAITINGTWAAAGPWTKAPAPAP